MNRSVKGVTDHESRVQMTGKRLPSRAEVSHTSRAAALCASFVLLALTLPACSWFPAVDLSPTYTPPEYVVPASWHGSSPFVEATPADSELRPDWWKLYDDPVLNRLIEQAMAANPDLQAAAERFVQARDVMMKARSQYLPQIGLGFGASNNRISNEKLFRPEGIHLTQHTVELGGIASWEPDFWSALRNATRVEIYRAEERAADYGLARLSLQAEIASDYFMLRGLRRAGRDLYAIDRLSTKSRSTSSRGSSPARSRRHSTSPASNLCCSAPRRN